MIDNTSSGHENPINPETGVSPTNTSQKTHKVQLGVSPPTNPEAENRPDPPLLSIQVSSVLMDRVQFNQKVIAWSSLVTDQHESANNYQSSTSN